MAGWEVQRFLMTGSQNVNHVEVVDVASVERATRARANHGTPERTARTRQEQIE